MLKRLFGIGKQQPPTPPAAPAAHRAANTYDKPATPYENYFNLHLYRVTVENAIAQIRENYLHHVPPGTVAAHVVEQGDWVTVYFPESVVKGLGFNRLAAQVARALDTWVIGYRIFAWQGMDVHYFNSAEHIEQLALSRNEIEFEPDDPVPFAPLTDISAVIPRQPDQHPLDYHFALLAALGIQDAARTWEEAQSLDGTPVTA